MNKPTNIWKEFSQSKEGDMAFKLIENEQATKGAEIVFNAGRLSAFKEMRDYAIQEKEKSGRMKDVPEDYVVGKIGAFQQILIIAEAKMKVEK